MPDHEGRDILLAAPTILDRSRHPISRRNMDPDALKVLNRLHRHGFLAYLVGGAVRDLMLGRAPQDFDVGTNARPRQVKKLFRNAYLIGRRFRLAQVRFHGGKVIEVATFRRDPEPGEPEPPPAGEDGFPEDAEFIGEAREAGAEPSALEEGAHAVAEDDPGGHAAEPGRDDESAEDDEEEGEAGEEAERGTRRGRPPLPPIAFGTPREDAFRRDITINALFYDIATFSVIDYTGGLEDLERRRIRVIGPPDRRYAEDPVRMWRVLRHAGRLGFDVEEETEASIARNKELLAGCSSARLYEELNKDLKSGAARPIIRGFRRHALLPILLGAPGEFYQKTEEAYLRLDGLLGLLDDAVAAGSPPSPPEIYGLLLFAWAEKLLAGFAGDRFKHLHDALGQAGMAAALPRALVADLVQTLVIADRMLSALETGRMRWALKRRARYAEASRLCALVVRGRAGEAQDPFEEMFRDRFGDAPETREKRRRRRRRRPRRKPPSAPATE